MAFINLILGASASGKTTIGNKIRTELNIVELISHTTRSPRQGEENGVSYHFVTKSEFTTIEMVESDEYLGDYYGISLKEIQKVNQNLSNGNHVFAILNLNGVRKIKEIFGEKARIIYIEVDPNILKDRMIKRGDSIEQIEKRLKKILEDNECFNHEYADIIINNDKDLDSAWEEVKLYFA